MFYNDIESNSIDENAISEIYQYAKIHKYNLKLNKNVYNKDKSIYYMKLSVILETIVEGLKKKNYDWVFWVNSDVSITNPGIKLETFLPTDENVHFLASSDNDGLNDGVFFIRVHPWSYDILLNAFSYSHYNKGKFLKFAEQTCLNNILSDESHKDHYVIVPNEWFNVNFDDRKKGDFIVHFKDIEFKNEKAMNLRKEINNEWYEASNNKDLRKEVLDYYQKSRSSQSHGGVFKEINYDNKKKL
ncbi:hypothetical protein BCR36DRAFT_400247 [Piromyces finnis]|uniref:Nucleotide-diphospho-sugar transferase domain-containing protein n=1 Tax=Piromyces finnis TaxID=1754191 RepID=A0A1Y1UWX6_9FUNG|nr:hypothetical protein BCR36DRAFT_400247 [Piromyces finnis]|eukprot:ORX42627.1 hypothetical protein BCR36DRAFT_400247 [Piromyces finnis]